MHESLGRLEFPARNGKVEFLALALIFDCFGPRNRMEL